MKVTQPGSAISQKTNNSSGKNKISAADRKLARENIDNPTCCALDLVKTKAYKIEKEDKRIARENPESLFADYLSQNPNFKIEEEDKKVARENPDTFFAYNLVKRSDYKITKDDREIARRSPLSMFADSIEENPNQR